MSSQPVPRVEIDGRPPAVAELVARALVNYGHFTAMQVRGGRTRGLGLHLSRLDAATRELFGVGLDGGRVRELVRHALDAQRTEDASVRVDVFQPDGDVSVMVTVRPPVDAPEEPQRLLSVAYLRPVAHVKHVGTFGQIHFGLRAERDGFHDALLTGSDGLIAETATANIGFFDGSAVVWPDAPALRGITMQLLDSHLPGAGVPCRSAAVRLADVPSFSAAFVANSTGVAPVGRIDGTELPADHDLMRLLTRVYDSVPLDPL